MNNNIIILYGHRDSYNNFNKISINILNCKYNNINYNQTTNIVNKSFISNNIIPNNVKSNEYLFFSDTFYTISCIWSQYNFETSNSITYILFGLYK